MNRFDLKWNFKILFTSMFLFAILFMCMQMGHAQWIYGSGEATNIENNIGFYHHLQKIVTGQTNDPSATGYVAAEGSILLRNNAGAGELWLKTGAADTAWGKPITTDAEGKIVGHGGQLLGFPHKQYFNDGEANYSATTRWITGNSLELFGMKEIYATVGAAGIYKRPASGGVFALASDPASSTMTGVTINISNGDIYASNNDNGTSILKSTRGSDNFVSEYTTVRNWTGMAYNPISNNVYSAVSGGDIYMQTNGTGAFAALSQTSRAWRGMAANPVNGNIYAAVYGGDIYMQTNGTGNFVALGQTSRNWRGMTAAPNGDIYAVVDGGDIYKQTAGAGNFVGLGETSRAWTGITVDVHNDVYASVNAGDIYRQINATGPFTAIGETSRAWSSLTSDILQPLFGTFTIDSFALNPTDTHSFKYDLTARSKNDYVLSKEFTIDDGRYVSVTFDYATNTASGDINVVLYCTNADTSYTIDSLPRAYTTTQFSGSVYIPAGCQTARVGFHTKVGTAGMSLWWNRMTVSSDLTVYKNVIDRGGSYGYANSAAVGVMNFLSTATLNDAYGYTLETTRITFTSDVSFNFMASPYRTGNLTTAYVYWKNSAGTTKASSGSSRDSTYAGTMSMTGEAVAGDYLEVAVTNYAQNIYWTITSAKPAEHIVTPATSAIEEVYVDGYTSKDVSGYILFKTVQKNTLSKLAAYSVASSYTKVTALKKVLAFPSATMNTSVTHHSFIYHYNSSNTLLSQSGFCGVAGQEAVGAMTITMNPGDYILIQTNTNMYDTSVINFKVTFVDFYQMVLSAIPTQQTCYIKDVKPSGTHAGSSVAGSWSTRTLNTINENGSTTSSSSSFVTLNGSSQFTIQPGTYKVLARSPILSDLAYSARIRLYNITASSADLYSDTTFSGSGNSSYVTVFPTISGTITISSPTQYAIEYYSTDAYATYGLGGASGIVGIPEVYTQVEITKIK